MGKQSLILVGAGGHARSCIDVVEQTGLFKVAGMIGSIEEVSSAFLGYKVIGTDEQLPDLVKRYKNALVAVGQIKSPGKRIEIYDRLLEIGFELPVIISPHAYVSRFAKLGQGTIVLHGAIINAGVDVGINCIINTHSLIEHDSKIGDHCHISTGAVINGDVTIGSHTFIGSASVVKHGCSVAENCIIDMGTVVKGNYGNQGQVFQ
ncbi:WbbJ Acetyltransferase (isoleucine patch superfamily) [Burkholderiaceae bacterium]